LTVAQHEYRSNHLLVRVVRRTNNRPVMGLTYSIYLRQRKPDRCGCFRPDSARESGHVIITPGSAWV
jgi:hypothetical protein